jgi:diguanylate cyclase (GGDEF)-like protein
MRRFAVALVLALGLLPLAQADVWGYIDERGVAHFAADRLDERYELFFRGNESPGAARTGTPRAVAVPTAAPKLIAYFEVSPSYKQVKHHLREASRTHGIDYELLKALIATESGFNAAAISPKGAVGLMQVMPATAAHQHRRGLALPALPDQPVPRPSGPGAGRLQRGGGRRAARGQPHPQLPRDPELREDRDAAVRHAQAAGHGRGGFALAQPHPCRDSRGWRAPADVAAWRRRGSGQPAAGHRRGMLLTDPDDLVALGAFTGAQVLVVCLSAVIANAYRERALLVHAAAGVMAVVALQLQLGGHPSLAQAALLLTLALAGLQLRDLVNHAGALRRPRRWLVGINAVLMPALALATVATGLPLLLPGLAAWTVAAIVLMLRAWPQSQPWARWLLPGLSALSSACAWLGWQSLEGRAESVLPVAALLAAWSAAVYLATVWRSRLFGETRVRLDARNTTDPLTGLSTPLVLTERMHGARSLMRRYGHPSVLMLVHIDNLAQLAAQHGPEVAEAALVVAASRIRQSLRDGDVAARLSHSRIAVLAEGLAPAEAAANLASRILVAGLKEPLAAAPGEFLQFRVVLAGVPVTELSTKSVLQRLGARMDEQLFETTERRIRTLSAEELAA